MSEKDEYSDKDDGVGGDGDGKTCSPGESQSGPPSTSTPQSSQAGKGIKSW